MSGGGGGLLAHKSWNVYNRDNINKVRTDELNAQRKQQEKEKFEQTLSTHDRLQALRDNAKTRVHKEYGVNSHSNSNNNNHDSDSDTNNNINAIRATSAHNEPANESTKKALAIAAELNSAHTHINLFPKLPNNNNKKSQQLPNSIDEKTDTFGALSNNKTKAWYLQTDEEKMSLQNSKVNKGAPTNTKVNNTNGDSIDPVSVMNKYTSNPNQHAAIHSNYSNAINMDNNKRKSNAISGNKKPDNPKDNVIVISDDSDSDSPPGSKKGKHKKRKSSKHKKKHKKQRKHKHESDSDSSSSDTYSDSDNKKPVNALAAIEALGLNEAETRLLIEKLREERTRNK